ncbi:autoinducer binding domain-containing protein [Glaciimonas sp. GG7]
MLSWQEKQTEALFSVKNDATFFVALLSAAKDLGFDYCAYGMRMPLPISQPKLIRFNNYSSSWQQRYEEANYLEVDPTVVHAAQSTIPILWSDTIVAASRPFWEDAQGHGLKVGCAQSFHDGRGNVGLLSLSRSEDHLTIKELGDISLKISWLAQIAHQALSRLLVEKLTPEAAANLTAREVEVLRWTADGKTSSEVGEIIGISERTVNFHVNNTLLKLGVTNKTAVAVKAAVLGLL